MDLSGCAVIDCDSTTLLIVIIAPPLVIGCPIVGSAGVADLGFAEVVGAPLAAELVEETDETSLETSDFPSTFATQPTS